MSLHRRSFLRLVAAFGIFGSKPNLLQLTSGVETSSQDTTRLVLGPNLTKTEVLARQQAAFKRFGEIVETYTGEICNGIWKDLDYSLMEQRFKNKQDNT